MDIREALELLLEVPRHTSYPVAPLTVLQVTRTLSVYDPSVADTPDGGDRTEAFLYPVL